MNERRRVDQDQRGQNYQDYEMNNGNQGNRWNRTPGMNHDNMNSGRYYNDDWNRDREGGSHHGDYSHRGFASMPKSELRRIASMGGKASHGGQSHHRGGPVSARHRSRSRSSR